MNRGLISIAAVLGFGATTSPAMADALFSCENLQPGYWCAAFDLGPGYEYHWSTSGQLSLEWSSDLTIPFKHLTCIGDEPGSGGYVYLTVVRPGQSSLQGHTYLRCRHGGGFGGSLR